MLRKQNQQEERALLLQLKTFVIHINKIHKTDGVSLVNPSEILAKLFDAIPNEIPIAKNKYPNKGFIIILLMQSC